MLLRAVPPFFLLALCTAASAQLSTREPATRQTVTFPQPNGSVVEVVTNERALINTPEPYTCVQDWTELLVLVRIDREGNAKYAQLLLSSNYSTPACTDEMLAHAQKLRFAPDPTARKTEQVFVTYRKTAKE